MAVVVAPSPLILAVPSSYVGIPHLSRNSGCYPLFQQKEVSHLMQFTFTAPTQSQHASRELQQSNPRKRKRQEETASFPIALVRTKSLDQHRASYDSQATDRDQSSQPDDTSRRSRNQIVSKDEDRGQWSNIVSRWRLSRAQDGDDDDDDDDDGRYERPTRDGPKRMREASDRLFACPYPKHQPSLSWARTSCYSGYKDFRRLKDHLHRAHKLSVCYSCGDTSSVFHPDRKHYSPCGRKHSEVEKWNKVFRTLFPGVPVPSPYIDDIPSRAIQQIAKNLGGSFDTLQNLSPSLRPPDPLIDIRGLDAVILGPSDLSTDFSEAIELLLQLESWRLRTNGDQRNSTVATGNIEYSASYGSGSDLQASVNNDRRGLAGQSDRDNTGRGGPPPPPPPPPGDDPPPSRELLSRVLGFICAFHRDQPSVYSIQSRSPKWHKCETREWTPFSELLKHYWNSHSLFICGECFVLFPTKEARVRHTKENSHCYHCFTSFPKTRGLDGELEHSQLFKMHRERGCRTLYEHGKRDEYRWRKCAEALVVGDASTYDPYFRTPTGSTARVNQQPTLPEIGDIARPPVSGEVIQLRAENEALRSEIEHLRRQHSTLLTTMLNISSCLRNNETAMPSMVPHAVGLPLGPNTWEQVDAIQARHLVIQQPEVARLHESTVSPNDLVQNDAAERQFSEIPDSFIDDFLREPPNLLERILSG